MRKYFSPTIDTRVCSDHFLPTDFKDNTARRILIKAAVPTKNLPTKLLYKGVIPVDLLAGSSLSDSTQDLIDVSIDILLSNIVIIVFF